VTRDECRQIEAMPTDQKHCHTERFDEPHLHCHPERRTAPLQADGPESKDPYSSKDGLPPWVRGEEILTPRVAPFLIAGIGNILLQDDGFGPQAIAHLEAEYDFGNQVELLDLGTPALDFVDYLVGREVVILLDALSCGSEPGDILTYDHAQLRQRIAGMRLSAHQPCLDETLFAAETADIQFQEVRLIGVVGSSFEVSTELGPHVRAAMPRAIQLVCEILSRRGVAVCRRAIPPSSKPWWQSTPSAKTSSDDRLEQF
jgi:hydrogenase maturation protease